MKKGGGGQKGSSFERKIAKKLSLWWTDNQRDDIFWRTSGSGARATSRSKKNKKTAYEYGDITFTDPIGKSLIDLFLIECKKGYSKEIDLSDFFEPRRNSKLFGWWSKAKEEQKEAGRRYSLLIVERNARPAFVLFDNQFLVSREGFMSSFVDYYIELRKDFEKNGAMVDSIIVMLLNDFLKWLSPEDIKGEDKNEFNNRQRIDIGGGYQIKRRRRSL